MTRTLLKLYATLLVTAFVTPVSAQENTDSKTASGTSSKVSSQTIYKGVIGNVLDAVPMDPEKRATLQKTSAVVSGTLSGRSLATLAGLSNPVLMLGGLIWGAWAASNIKPRDIASSVAIKPAARDNETVMENVVAALGDYAQSGDGRLPNPPPEPATVESALSTSIAANVQRTPVVKVWLPQRSVQLP